MEDDRCCLDGTKRTGVDRFYFCQEKKEREREREREKKRRTFPM